MVFWEFNKRTINDLESNSDYLLKAKQICLDWLEGRGLFTLTTSGSTGKPKKIGVTANQLRASVRATENALSLHRNTKALVCLNIEYVAGFMMLIRAMELDWEIVLIPPCSNPLLNLPPKFSFDFTPLAPMQLSEILAHTETSGSLKKLGKILLGGVGLTNEQNEVFGNLPIDLYMGYGMTETVSHVALRRISNSHSDRNTYYVTGDIQFGTDARGCLFFNGDVTNNQTIQTNDLATLLPEQRAFRLLGRIDNVVNSGGVKIQTEELESKLYTLFRDAGIKNNFFLWKMPDKKLGEALVLVVEGPPALEQRLREIITLNLHKHKKPRKVLFTEQFLRTGSQKLDKYRTFEALIKSV